MVQTQSSPITLEAFLALPETKPASEFIDGQVSQKPMPLGKHSAIRAGFSHVIHEAVRADKVACVFPELQCIFDGNAVVPDISVFTWQRLPIDDNGEIANVFPIAPDWMIEILSPGQRYAKVIQKIQCCLQHGTEMGWLIEPNDRAVLIHQPAQAIQVILAEEPNTVLPMPSFMGELSYTIEDLFNLLLA